MCFSCFFDPVPSSEHVLVGSVVNRVLARKSVERVHLQCSKLLLLDVDVGSGNWKTHSQISFEAVGTLTFAEGVTTTAATRWCDHSSHWRRGQPLWKDVRRVAFLGCDDPWPLFVAFRSKNCGFATVFSRYASTSALFVAYFLFVVSVPPSFSAATSSRWSDTTRWWEYSWED